MSDKDWPSEEDFLNAATLVCVRLGIDPSESEHCLLAITISGWMSETFPTLHEDE